jgi:hypothetical protein
MGRVKRKPKKGWVVPPSRERRRAKQSESNAQASNR